MHVYAVLKKANDKKLHVIATKHEANTYSEHLVHSRDDVSNIELTPHWNLWRHMKPKNTIVLILFQFSLLSESSLFDINFENTVDWVPKYHTLEPTWPGRSDVEQTEFSVSSG